MTPSGKIWFAVGVLGAGAAAAGIAFKLRRGRGRESDGAGDRASARQPRTFAPSQELGDRGARFAAPAQDGKIKPMSTTAYSTETWRPVLIPLVAIAGIPIEFVLKWIDVESAGQPCAVGNAFASFDGGAHPRETGIVQLYGPDDYKTTHADPSALRAYCMPKYAAVLKGPDGRPLLDANGQPKTAMAFSQQCSRELTADEMYEQARVTVALVEAEMARADRLLAGVGSAWSRSSPDYWKFVKLQHGIPGLANAIGYVKDVLGYAPTTWAQYRATVLTPECEALIKAHDPGTYNYVGEFAKVLANAEKTGGAVVAPPSATV